MAMRFGPVAHFGGSAVGVDVIDLLRLDAGVAQRVAHHAKGAVAVVGRRGDVEGVGAHAVAHHFGQDVGAARAREFQFFQHQDAGAFAHHEAVAVLIPGAGSALAARRCAWKARAWRRIRRCPWA